DSSQLELPKNPLCPKQWPEPDRSLPQIFVKLRGWHRPERACGRCATAWQIPDLLVCDAEDIPRSQNGANRVRYPPAKRARSKFRNQRQQHPPFQSPRESPKMGTIPQVKLKCAPAAVRQSLSKDLRKTDQFWPLG